MTLDFEALIERIVDTRSRLLREHQAGRPPTTALGNAAALVSRAGASPATKLCTGIGPKTFTVVSAAAPLVGDDLAAVGSRDKGVQPQVLAIEHRVTGDRPAARAVEYGRQRDFGADAECRRAMIDLGQKFVHAIIVRPAFDADRALAHRGQHRVGRDGRADIPEAEAVEASARQNNRIGCAVLELAQPCIDVAAHRLHPEVGAKMQQQGLAGNETVATVDPCGKSEMLLIRRL